MKLSLDGELSALTKNASARLGVQPATAAKAALRYGLERIGFEDVEAELTPAQAREREQQRKAKEARDALRRIGA